MWDGPEDLASSMMADALPSSLAPSPRLDHLQRLEAESIHILREVAAERAKPVLLYSIGKDSAVLLHPGHQGPSIRASRRFRCCTSIRPGSSGR